MGWLTRIKDSLNKKIKKKIPKKDLESAEKTRLEKKTKSKKPKIELEVLPKKIIEQKKELPEKPKQKKVFGFFKKKEISQIEKDPEKKTQLVSKIKYRSF